MKVSGFGQRHLTYCSNVHPGESLRKHLAEVDRHLERIRGESHAAVRMGMGLRVASLASEELMQPSERRFLQQWLQERNLYLFTLNGFPYGAFHRTRVKEAVHEPDWSTRERHDYTLRLIDLLAALVPEGVNGSISTSPITYKYGFHSGHAMEWVETQAAASLADLAWEMETRAREDGVEIHLDLEPEPDGYLERVDEWIGFMKESLLRTGVDRLKQKGLDGESAESILRRRIRLCYDTCHMAIAWEEPSSVLERLDREGFRLGKVQLSSALAVDVPSALSGRQRLREELSPFAEPVYLHQVVGLTASGEKRQYRDLPDALDFLDRCSEVEWRIHFHIPLFAEPTGTARSTRDHIGSLLNCLSERKDGEHLEIETYTWDLLPTEMKLDLGSSIHRELRWVLSEIESIQGSSS